MPVDNEILKKVFKGEGLAAAEFTNLMLENDSLEICKPWIRAQRRVESIQASNISAICGVYFGSFDALSTETGTVLVVCAFSAQIQTVLFVSEGSFGKREQGRVYIERKTVTVRKNGWGRFRLSSRYDRTIVLCVIRGYGGFSASLPKEVVDCLCFVSFLAVYQQEFVLDGVNVI
jgi:hypothetical protein